ncbi:putative copper homeostasis (lipo)protein LpqS [Mycobacteroides abscessus]|uniref:hypothetical protein n=1 Tax=Mycobacteroides abscessus TaxID=36809 RepID=UPI000940E9B9|nr:hypothetical protein [Mycobacteroides abscessus]
MLPSTGEGQPLRNSGAGRPAVSAIGGRGARVAPWLGAAVVAVLAALLVAQCGAMPHHGAAATALPHHAVAAGSTLQRSTAAIAPHNHFAVPASAICAAAADAVSAALAAPTVLRVLWIAVLALVACAALWAGAPALTRGPPPHTGPVAIAAGRMLIHRFCVLRR